MESKSFMSMQSLWGSLSDFTRDVLFKDVPRIIIALIILWIGLKLINLSLKRTRKEYEIVYSNCIACGKCFDYCPQNRKMNMEYNS